MESDLFLSILGTIQNFSVLIEGLKVSTLVENYNQRSGQENYSIMAKGA